MDSVKIPHYPITMMKTFIFWRINSVFNCHLSYTPRIQRLLLLRMRCTLPDGMPRTYLEWKTGWPCCVVGMRHTGSVTAFDTFHCVRDNTQSNRRLRSQPHQHLAEGYLPTWQLRDLRQCHATLPSMSRVPRYGHLCQDASGRPAESHLRQPWFLPCIHLVYRNNEL